MKIKEIENMGKEIDEGLKTIKGVQGGTKKLVNELMEQKSRVNEGILLLKGLDYADRENLEDTIEYVIELLLNTEN